jgi:hypothetical protein
MEDKEYIGSSGVDTQKERDQINYRPNIAPPEPKKSGGTIGRSSDGQPNLELDSSIPYPATDIYVKINDTYDYVTNLVSRLKEEL